MPKVHLFPNIDRIVGSLLERVEALERLIHTRDVDHYYVVSSYITAGGSGSVTVAFGVAFPERPIISFGAERPPGGGVLSGSWLAWVESWTMSGARYSGAVIKIASTSTNAVRIHWTMEGFVR